jgi:hypothetical protein
MQMMRNTFKDTGLKFPRTVVWNLRDSDEGKGFPFQKNDADIIAVSGFSSSILKFIMETENFEPEQFLISMLSHWEKMVRSVNHIFKMVPCILNRRISAGINQFKTLSDHFNNVRNIEMFKQKRTKVSDESVGSESTPTSNETEETEEPEKEEPEKEEPEDPLSQVSTKELIGFIRDSLLNLKSFSQ